MAYEKIDSETTSSLFLDPATLPVGTNVKCRVVVEGLDENGNTIFIQDESDPIEIIAAETPEPEDPEDPEPEDPEEEEEEPEEPDTEERTVNREPFYINYFAATSGRRKSYGVATDSNFPTNTSGCRTSRT